MRRVEEAVYFPAMHAIAGCYTTCSLNRLGKKRHCLRFIEKKVSVTHVRKEGQECTASLNDFRYLSATTIDKPAAVLPTDDAFKQHVLRVKYHCKIWCESHIAM